VSCLPGSSDRKQDLGDRPSLKSAIIEITESNNRVVNQVRFEIARDRGLPGLAGARGGCAHTKAGEEALRS